MRWPVSIIVLIGLFHASYAELYFDMEEQQNLTTALSKIPEDYSTFSKIVGTRLNCYDTDESSTERRALRLKNGQDYVNLSPKPMFWQSSGIITIRRDVSIDYEKASDSQQQNSRNVIIECFTEESQLSVEFAAPLVITDVNDNEPVFERTNITYQTSIDETLHGADLPLQIHPPASNLGAIIVRDIDGVDNNKVTAICKEMYAGLKDEPIPCDGYFSVVATRTGNTDGLYLFTVYALLDDYMGNESFSLKIQAKNEPEDPAQPTLYSLEQNVLILISDIQNMPPYVDPNSLFLEMYEDLLPNMQVDPPTAIGAFDLDVRNPNAINFVLMPDNNDTFAMDEYKFKLGTVYKESDSAYYRVPLLLNNTIDREKIDDPSKQLHLIVKAFEDPEGRPNRNPMSTEARITVRILDRNDQIPTFQRSEYNIVLPELRTVSANPENFYQISNSIDSIVVIDRDSAQFNSYTVEIISGNEQNLFKLNKYTGSGEESFILSAKEKILDYETPPNLYRLSLRATDEDNPSFTSIATMTINITDANDHVPTFDDTIIIFGVNESSPIGQFVGRVNAYDLDSGLFGTIVRYEILDQEIPFDLSQNGDLTVAGFLDYEVKRTYSFTVRALDGGVGEDQKDGTVLVRVAIINLADQDLKWSRVYYAQLAEESFNLVPALIIEASSDEEDIVGAVEYFIEAVEPPSVPFDTFVVNRNTGVVEVTRFVNHNQSRNGSVEVTFRAQAGSISSTTTALINIIDLNNFAPEFRPTNRYFATVSELAPAGFEVIQLSVYDGDGPGTSNGKVRFQIISGANDDFLITGDSGVIMVTATAVLDIEERQGTYDLTIEASDDGDPRKSNKATVTIELEDANNKNPVFERPLYTFQIMESNVTGSPIDYVSATDLDSESLLDYSIDYISAKFQLRANDIQDYIDPGTVVRIDHDSGLLRVAGPINRNIFDRVDFKVIATDINVPADQPIQTATASVVIFIQAAVDPRIYFSAPWTRDNPIITKTFSETSQTNTQIMSLTATDPVIPETVRTYRIMESSDPQDYFYINERVLYSKKPLDYEAITTRGLRKISCIVEAISEDEQRTSTATIEIVIQDINDNMPVFGRPEYSFTIGEDKVFAKEVGRVRAQDRDSSSYGQVDFFLAGSNSEDFFTYIDASKSTYNPTNGSESEAVIIVAENATLDFETLNVYNLLLYARDNPGGNNNVRFSSSVAVEIIVQDVNDMYPEFQEKVYEFNIIGMPNSGGDVGFIYAEDGDAGRNGEVQYDIIKSTNEGAYFFDIETQRQTSANVGQFLDIGRIFVRKSLLGLPDRSLFELNITARDQGRNPKFGYCIVRITVSKGVQDLKPKWDERLASRVQIEEEQPVGTFVASMLAYPADAASSIIYSFVGAGDSFRDYDSFSIDPNTGVITTNVVLDMEVKRNYNLLILATDSMNSTLTNQFLLTVQVIDVDDNVPSFLDCEDISYDIPEEATVREEQGAGVFVFRAQACDLDQPPHDRVKYAWFRDSEYCLAQNLQHFSLDEDTGIITTRVRLDRERKDKYLLCVMAFQDSTKRKKRDMTSDLRARENHDTVLYVLVTVLDVNDLGPKFLVPSVKKVILKYPQADVSVAEAYDEDLPPNNGIRYSIDSIMFIIDGKPQNAPTAFTVNGKDGTISIGTNDYTDYVGGYFDITIRADDFNGADVEPDTQLQRVYVTDQANRIRVVINRPADEGVDRDAKEMITKLNALDDDVYYEIKTISYHVTSNNDDPRFDKTDVCMLVVRDNSVLTSVSAAKQFNDVTRVKSVLEDYGAVDPGPCDPATSVYPVGWESYWWVLVAFAIFIFVCCVILIFMICQLFRQYKQYMESRQTYLVPGNNY